MAPAERSQLVAGNRHEHRTCLLRRQIEMKGGGIHRKPRRARIELKGGTAWLAVQPVVFQRDVGWAEQLA